MKTTYRQKKEKEQTNKQKHRITLARENHSESMTTIFITTDKIYPSFDINESNKEFQTGLQKTLAPKILF